MACKKQTYNQPGPRENTVQENSTSQVFHAVEELGKISVEIKTQCNYDKMRFFKHCNCDKIYIA